ncbi:hypothetical protein LTR53_004800 [Teratosphaeriaceae sp. CCFEE 6253]|nr:hypothetical protein LTR53_004800 [Teratosphaeriaceae sp. CCFEE 6253]
MSMMATATAQRIPAWKRLGLKLKYAKDTTDEPAIHGPSHSLAPLESIARSGNKRPADDDDYTHVKSTKKRKSPTAGSSRGNLADATPSELPSNSGTPTSANGTSVAHDIGRRETVVERTTRPVRSLATTLGSRRKSVTFTPDTKTEDTDSAQRLFKQWSSEEAEQQQAVERSDQLTSTGPEPAKAAKREKKAKPQHSAAKAPDRRPSTPSSEGETPEYVRYLEQYHTDKAFWKFNKNKQKDLLKHLFDIQRIPAAHDGAIIEYLKGLQGAAAQQRVLDDAEEVLAGILETQGRSAEIDGMESHGARRAAYEVALQREIDKIDQAGGGRSEYDEQQLLEIRRDVQRGNRAEAVLAELLSREPVGPSSTAASPLTSASVPASETAPIPKAVHVVFSDDAGAAGEEVKPVPRKRKRKARTEVSFSDDSSSSDSSESESE